jgi:branched-chain amino acid transport system ATP-binding protein
MSAVLSVEKISVRYGAITAIRGISLSVQEGELVALIGVNGAGKSTTLSTIAGGLKPHEGTITFQGEQIQGKPPEYITGKGIALVPEGRDILPSLTVGENLRLGAFVRRSRSEFQRDQAEMIEMFPILGERLRQAAGTLSGGEQQQLAVARALMSHPRLLMLDEPSLGLSPVLVGQIFELIERLHKRGVTILLVEQNVERTLDIVDRAYLLHTGEVEVEGTPAHIREFVDVEGVYLGDTRRAPQRRERP